MPDLPIVGAPSWIWGTELLTWLEHDHKDNGTHKEMMCIDDKVMCVDDNVVYLTEGSELE